METVEQFHAYIRTFGEIMDDDDRLRITPPSLPIIQNGLVYFLHTHTDKKEFISRLIGIASRNGIVEDNVKLDALIRSTRRLVKAIDEKKRSNLKRNAANVTLFLKQCFVIPCATTDGTSTGSATASTAAERTSTQGKASTTKDTVARPRLVMPSPKKLKTDCSKCVNRRKTVKHLMKINKERKQNLDDSLISNSGKSALKQALDRKQEIEKRLRLDRRRLRRQLMEKTSQLKQLKGEAAEDEKKRKRKIQRRRSKLVPREKLAAAQEELLTLKKIKNNLERENERLQAILMEDKDSNTTTISVKKDNKTYSTGYRKAAYRCLLEQVPVYSTASVICSVVKEVTGLTVKEKADPTTVSQFAYELGVMNDIQIVESVSTRQLELGMGCHLP